MKKLGDMPREYRFGDAESAVTSFLRLLGQVRSSSYQLVGQPDVETRNRPAADFLFTEFETGRIIAIEHTKLIRPTEAEVSALLSHGRTPREPSSQRLRRDAIRLMRVNPDSLTPMSHVLRFDDEQLEWLKRTILSKSAKKQLAHTSADERLLLLEAWLLDWPDKFFDSVELGMTASERDGIDGCFIILEQRVVRVVW